MFGKRAKGPNGGGTGRTAMPLSVIGADVRIVGDIITQGEMQIDGQVEGDISCARLVVGESARITGAIKADTVRIHGRVTGTIDADAVKIARSAEVIGDVTHATMEMEAGGQVEGHLIRKGATPALAAPRPALAAPADNAADKAAPAANAADKADGLAGNEAVAAAQ